MFPKLFFSFVLKLQNSSVMLFWCIGRWFGRFQLLLQRSFLRTLFSNNNTEAVLKQDTQWQQWHFSRNQHIYVIWSVFFTLISNVTFDISVRMRNTLFQCTDTDWHTHTLQMLAPSADCYLSCCLYFLKQTLRFPLTFIASPCFLLSWTIFHGTVITHQLNR